MSESLPPCCPACGTFIERLADFESTVSGLGVELAKKTAAIKRLQGGQANGRPPQYNDAMEIALYWKALCMPKARELEGSRIDRTCARLKHYSKDDLRKAVFGYSCYPHRGEYGKRLRAEQGGKWDADLSKIMLDPTHVDAGIAMADREQGYDQGVLRQGARREFARLCDCGHPMVEHGQLWLNGHDACCDKECDCRHFDDLHRQGEEWLSRNNYAMETELPNAQDQVEKTARQHGLW
jgi:hypothetical protein